MARNGKKTPDPSPAEIKAAAAKIRENWNDRTYRIRSGMPPEVADRATCWTPPTIREDEWAATLREGLNESAWHST